MQTNICKSFRDLSTDESLQSIASVPYYRPRISTTAFVPSKCPCPYIMVGFRAEMEYAIL